MSKLSKWLWRQNVKNVEVVYELKPGSYYLIEYQAGAVAKTTIADVTKWLENRNIHVMFISNPTNHRAFEPVPAKPNQDKD